MTQQIHFKQVRTCSQDHYQRSDIHQRGATLPIRAQENQYTSFWDNLCTCIIQLKSTMNILITKTCKLTVILILFILLFYAVF
jgi:hypothetical protein